MAAMVSYRVLFSYLVMSIRITLLYPRYGGSHFTVINPSVVDDTLVGQVSLVLKTTNLSLMIDDVMRPCCAIVTLVLAYTNLFMAKLKERLLITDFICKPTDAHQNFCMRSIVTLQIQRRQYL